MFNGWGWFFAIVCIIVGTIVWVEQVWDGDYRCVVAECRIVKK